LPPLCSIDPSLVGGAATSFRGRREAPLPALEQVPRCGEQGDVRRIAAFTQVTGIDVRIENEWQDDIQTKAAIAVNVGSGPDIVWTLNATAHLFPDKLLDVTDVAEYVGKKYGGWYPIVETYGKSGDRWIAIPNILVGVLPTYRISWMNDAGFDKFPTDSDRFLKLCQQLQKIGHPAGFAFGHSTNDGSCWCHWLLWSHGGRIVEARKPRRSTALRLYGRRIRARHLRHDGPDASWNDASNNSIPRRRDRAD
jgi:multiple sugar transport system substrate-binding protein